MINPANNTELKECLDELKELLKLKRLWKT